MTNNIKKIRKSKGIQQNELAEQLGMHVTSLNRIENNRSAPSLKRITQLAEALGVDVSDLMQDDITTQEVPIVGFVGAGAEITPDLEQVPPGGLNSVSLPFGMDDDMIAFEVKGDGMLPRYDDGDVIVAYRNQRRPTDTFYGSEAVVKTMNGKRYIKQVLKGAKGINLMSWNAKPIENVSIDWVGEIYVTIRADQIPRALKKK